MKSPLTEAFTAAQINCLEDKVAPNSIINLQELYVNSTNTDECQNCSIKMIKGLIIHCDIETLIQGNCQNVAFTTRTITSSIFSSDTFYRFSKSYTVGTPNKGQLFFEKMGQIREIWKFPYSPFLRLHAK